MEEIKKTRAEINENGEQKNSREKSMKSKFGSSEGSKNWPTFSQTGQKRTQTTRFKNERGDITILRGARRIIEYCE